ncbi:hypothetical protein QBC39DRAFT_278440 [Podospora conica]|nr:hypothetical protein QBC39DRAFT_278440 [Schizothecium conicum]
MSNVCHLPMTSGFSRSSRLHPSPKDSTFLLKSLIVPPQLGSSTSESLHVSIQSISWLRVKPASDKDTTACIRSSLPPLNINFSISLSPKEKTKENTMKVLVLGLPRTGTQSLSDALIILGISPVYHMREVTQNDYHIALWTSAVAAKFEGAGAPWTTRADFDRVLAGFEGAADYPASIFPAELAAAYPEAAIILSVRSEDQWCASMASTLVHLQRARARAGDAPTAMAALAALYHRHCWGEDFEATGRAFFREHNDLVRGLAEGRRFLEWRPQDGWGPLCEFLGVEAPVEGTPFPRSDVWVEYKKAVEAEKLMETGGGSGGS